MNVTVKTLPETTVAYIPATGYGPHLNQTWQELGKWINENNLGTPETYGIGVCWDCPKVVPADQCKYDACFTLPIGYTITPPTPIQTKSLPGGTYAVTTITGPMPEISAKIGKAFDELVETWLPTSGYIVDQRPSYEIYPNESCNGQTFTCDICVAVKPVK